MKSSDFSRSKRHEYYEKNESIRLKNNLSNVSGMEQAKKKLGATNSIFIRESFSVVIQLNVFSHRTIKHEFNSFVMLLSPTKLQIIKTYSKMKEQI